MDVVREVEKGAKTFEEVRRRYGIRGTATVQKWVRKLGSGNIGGIIRMEKPEEINELARLIQKCRLLTDTVANLHMDLAMEKECSKMLADLAGVKDLEEFKKKQERNEPGKL